MKFLKQQGFTLVEIVIVLALAALILGLSLAAISEANKAARDAKRKDAVSKIVTAMEKWASQNSGTYQYSDGNVVSVDLLYDPTLTTPQRDGVSTSDCNQSAAYLDCDVVDPASGLRYINTTKLSALASPGQFMMITDRTGQATSGSGYCVRLKLEGGDTIWGASDLDRRGHNMNNGCQ